MEEYNKKMRLQEEKRLEGIRKRNESRRIDRGGPISSYY